MFFYLDSNVEYGLVADNYATIALGGETRNVEYLGTFVAWLVINHLLDPQVELAAGTSAARVRMQDMTGSAFLTTVLHGELSPAHLNDAGRQFVERYFVDGQYQEEFSQREYRGDNEWTLYDEIAPKITAVFRRPPKPRRIATILKFPGRKR